MADEITIHLTVTGEQGSPRVPLKISKSISAANLLKSASETTKIPFGTLKLIFRGRLIASDENKIAADEYKLEEGSVLHCMGKPVKDNSADSGASLASSAASTSTAAAAPRPTLIPTPAAPLPVAASASLPSFTAPNDPLLAALQAMRASNSAADYQTAVQVLDKLLANIIAHPMEEKYRRVKKQNPAFQRRLGGISGGEAVLLEAGFVTETDETGADVFMMQPRPDAWPKLLETKAKVEQAVRQGTAPSFSMPAAAGAAPAFGSMGAPFMPVVGGAGSPNVDGMRSAFLRNPAMMQSMMQSPMFQNMLRNDPRIANNPMLQQALQDPQMLAQITQLMQDPQMQQQLETMMQNPQMMQQMEQQMQAMGLPPLGGTPAAGFPNFMPPLAGANTNAGTRTNTGAAGQQRQAANDEDLTEEEMIAEAIRRSLQDQGPPS